jgi:hypothetical protein
MLITVEQRPFLKKVQLALEYALKESLGEPMKPVTPRDVQAVATLETLKQELK